MIPFYEAVQAAEPVPGNDIVVIVDTSGSFHSRLGDAMGQVETLLSGIAARKLKRWEHASDRVAVISLDALPAVIWEGTPAQLKLQDSGSWGRLLAGRADYSGCTDVRAAFDIAAARVAADDPKYVDSYVFAFSDLVHEPPSTSLRRCHRAAAPSPPSPDFPWLGLRNASTSIFWLPPAQMLVWDQAVRAAGMGEAVKLYSTSQSIEGFVAAPRAAKVDRTDVELQAAREGRIATVWGWVQRIGISVACLVLAVLALAVVSGRSKQQAVQRRPRPAGSRPRPTGAGPRPTPPQVRS